MSRTRAFRSSKRATQTCFVIFKQRNKAVVWLWDTVGCGKRDERLHWRKRHAWHARKERQIGCGFEAWSYNTTSRCVPAERNRTWLYYQLPWQLTQWLVRSLTAVGRLYGSLDWTKALTQHICGLRLRKGCYSVGKEDATRFVRICATSFIPWCSNASPLFVLVLALR